MSSTSESEISVGSKENDYTLDDDNFHKKLCSKRHLRNQEKHLKTTPKRKRNINGKQDIGKPTTKQKKRRSRSLQKGKNNTRRRSTEANSENRKRQLQRIFDVYLRSGVRYFMVEWDDGEKTCELAEFINICSPQKEMKPQQMHYAK